MTTTDYDPMPVNAMDALNAWLNDNVTDEYKQQPLAQDWARLSKVAEELGETIAAFIGETGQNPRKGFTHDGADVMYEACDTAITILLFMTHKLGDARQVRRMMAERWAYRLMKAGLL